MYHPPPINQSLVQRLNDAENLREEFLESNNSRSRIVRNQEWDPTLAKLDTLDFAELVFGLLGLDTVHSEATLGIVDETEVLAGLLDGDDIHETGRVGRIGADLAVDFDQTLHEDGLGLAAVQGVLETEKKSASQPNCTKLARKKKGDTNRLRMKTIKGKQSRSL